MIDVVLRCFNRARWLAFATTRNIIDANGVPVLGFDIDEIGNYEITPAVLTGNVITTPAILDTWWMVNLRLSSAKFDADVDTLYAGETDTGFKFVKSKIVALIRNQATLQSFNGWRAYRFGAGVNQIQLIDPRDVATPKRVWLGGMSF